MPVRDSAACEWLKSAISGHSLIAGGRLLNPESSHPEVLRRSAGTGRVRMWRGGLRFGLSVAAPFGWRCLNSRTITPFPHPSHRTGHADFPHPALGQNSCLCTRKVIRSSPDPQHRAVLPRRAPTERSAHNRQCHHLGGHSLPGSQSEFFLRFRMWRLPPLPHITGVS
jgi:hypothetical protein